MKGDRSHRKHTKLHRAENGQYAPLEVSILGAPCDVISAMANRIMEKLPDLRIAYIDAEHGAEDTSPENGGVRSQMTVTKRGSHYRIDLPGDVTPWQRKALFFDRDLVLVNGNHFEAKHQILLLDHRKPLHKRADRITAPLMVVRQNKTDTIPDIPEKRTEMSGLPLLDIDATVQIASAIRRVLSGNTPQLFGLVLAGGMSKRMGKDKGNIVYHGKPQRAHMFDMLKNHTENTFLSCRADQAEELSPEYPVLVDTFTGLGPYGALLSAFRAYPDKAWLVVACDIPLIGEEDLQQLVLQRDASRTATAFHNVKTGFPEPLITIWEPKTYPLLLQFLGSGVACPRKVLINSDVKTIEPRDPRVLQNVNNPEERASILRFIGNAN